MSALPIAMFETFTKTWNGRVHSGGWTIGASDNIIFSLVLHMSCPLSTGMVSDVLPGVKELQNPQDAVAWGCANGVDPRIALMLSHFSAWGML